MLHFMEYIDVAAVEFLKTTITYASYTQNHKIDELVLMVGNKWLGKVIDTKRSDSGDRWEASIILSSGGGENN